MSGVLAVPSLYEPELCALMRRLEAAEAEANGRFAEALARMNPASGAGTRSIAGGALTYAGPGLPMSQALGLGLEGAVDDALLDEVEAWLGRGGAAVTVSVLPAAHESLSRTLAGRGYRLAEMNQVLVRAVERSPGDARPAGAPPAAAAASPPWIDVSEMKPGEEEELTRAVVAGFFNRETVDAEVAASFAPNTRAQGVTSFAARLDGRIVGAGSLVVHDGIAVLSGTAVLPSARGRGLHAALIAARLAKGPAAGAQLATSSTLPGSGSQRNLERQGFRVAYCKAMLVRERAADGAWRAATPVSPVDGLSSGAASVP